jgi:curli biogenesis system outer membrane secretion channel CsgG
MKKKLLITFFAIIICTFSYSQEPKKFIIAIPGFNVTTGSDIDNNVAQAIQQRVIDVFVKNKKFTVVERNQLDQISKEVDLQKTETFMDGSNNISDKIKSTGANYLLTGAISSVIYSQETKTKYKSEPDYSKEKFLGIQPTKQVAVGTYPAFYCTIELNLKLIDLKTAQIVKSEVISSRNNGNQTPDMEGAANKENAYTGSVQNISGYATSFVKVAFPNVLQIAEITEKDRSGNAKDMLLVGDFIDYILEGQRLYVKLVVETEVAGRKLIRRKTIGEVKVQKIEDGGFINVRVKKGEEEITKAFDAKSKIEITEVE